MLASNGDVIALLGTAQQELSIRRRYQLQHALPKDMASLCSNENIQLLPSFLVMMPINNQNSKKNYHSGCQRPHPYKRGQNRPFLGQTPLPSPPPAVQSTGELQQPQGARKTLEPERGREVQGEKITNSKKSER